MTANQINFAKQQEDYRHNVASESATLDYNREVERHNREMERLTGLESSNKLAISGNSLANARDIAALNNSTQRAIAAAQLGVQNEHYVRMDQAQSEHYNRSDTAAGMQAAAASINADVNQQNADTRRDEYQLGYDKWNNISDLERSKMASEAHANNSATVRNLGQTWSSIVGNLLPLLGL